MAVATYCGQTTDTPMPRSPYAMASDSASPTAACLVTLYAVSPTWLSSPAADATLTR